MSIFIRPLHSAKSVEAAIKRHILDTWPDLAESKASSITSRELNKVIAKVVGAGKGREAAKLRSYIRAAFACALRAEGDATIPAALHGFNLEVNPAADLAALSQFNKVRETALTLPELRTLWLRLLSVNGVTGAALRLCLLLGGQRPSQLLRIKITDVDLHANTVVLYDPKGKRTQPRKHTLPLTDAACAELKPWVSLHSTGYVLSSTYGQTPIRPESLSNAFAAIAKEMQAHGELNKEVRLADLRRTVETILAAAKVPMEVRAQLQSHGLGGVQNRHYDKHQYMDEKLNAMDVLYRLMTETNQENVIPIRRAG